MCILFVSDDRIFIYKIAIGVQMFGIGDSLVRSAQDILQGFLWTIINPLITLINTLLNSLFNGVLNLDLFTNNSFLSGAFKCSLALMFLIIPVKIIYEIITSMIKDDDAGMDFQKKIGSAFLGIIIACSLTLGITKVINPMVTNITRAMLHVNLISSDASAKQNYQIGDRLIETVLVSFGGLSESGDYGAKEFIKQYNAGNLNIIERYDNDTATHQKYEYKWNISLFMTIIGLAIYVIMIFIVVIQVSLRMIAIGFYYIIGPICCSSMTNYQNPQAFVVWKNTLIGQWLQNITQIFLLALMVALLDAITAATKMYPIACAALYFGAFSLTIYAPSFVQAMIGGYASGVMDMMNSFRGGFGMAKSSVMGTIGAVTGRNNPNTGHLNGGLRGAIMGNKNMNDERRGGARGFAIGNLNRDTGYHRGGVRGAIVGNKDKNGQLQGGLRGAFNGNGSRKGAHAGGNANEYTNEPQNLQSNLTRDEQADGANGRMMDTSNIGNAADLRQDKNMASSTLGKSADVGNISDGFSNIYKTSNKNDFSQPKRSNMGKGENKSFTNKTSSKKEVNVGLHDRGENTTKNRSFRNPFLK